MKRFDRYFLWVFIQSFVVVAALCATIFLVVDILLNLDKIQGFADVASGTATFYALNLPPMLYLLYPLMLFVAGMFAVTRLIRSREILLLEAAGVSRKRALSAIMIPVLLLGILGLGLRQAALPALAQEARESPYGAFEFRQGRRISVRDDGGNVWFVRRYNLDTRTVEDVRILRHDGEELITAPELLWIDERGEWWAPRSAELFDLGAMLSLDSPDSPAREFEGALPFGNLFPADFARRRRGYKDRSLTELISDSIARPVDRELRVNLWREIWHPLAGFILLSCGVGLVLARGGRGMFMSGSLAIAAVVGYQILAFWFETLAVAGAFPPALGVSLTPILFSVLGLVVFIRT